MGDNTGSPQQCRVSLSALVRALVRASEKASNLARACRAEEELFSLLTQEKGQEDKNPRFLRDFKTLADVLIQEMLKHDLSKLDSGFGERVQGEETNKFTNGRGETVCVEVCSSLKETAQLLVPVLDGNEAAAAKLAQIVHSDAELLEEIDVPDTRDVNVGNIGVWIDPIDSTSEYISGKWGEEDESGIVTSGLQCVCVLIGVYFLDSGRPFIGVVNQPFHHLDQERRPVGRCYWAVSQGANSLVGKSFVEDEEKNREQRQQPIVLLSTGEQESIVDALGAAGFRVRFAAGAGYKILCVALRSADAYLLTKGTTFRWDTCSPEALLGARGIDLRRLDASARGSDSSRLDYTHPDPSFANLGPSARWRNNGCLLACHTSCDSLAIERVLRKVAEFRRE